MPTLGLVGGLRKYSLHYTLPILRKLSSLKSLPIWEVETLKFQFFSEHLFAMPNQLLPSLEKKKKKKNDFFFSGIWSADSLRKVNFLGTCEHNPLNMNVTKSLSAFILIIMPNNGFFPVTFCNAVIPAFKGWRTLELRAVCGKRHWQFSNPEWQVSISVTLSPQGDRTRTWDWVTWVSTSNLTLLHPSHVRGS